MLAMVTGASSGIGAEYARQLHARGYEVILVARRRERLAQLGFGQPHVADLTNRDDVSALCDRLAREPVDLLVNNAGIGGYKRLWEQEPRVLEEIVDGQVRAVVRMTRAALPGMVARKAGGVINVASLLALSGTLPAPPLPFRATYAGAKAFLLAFSQTLAQELGGTGVKAQCCLPGVVATEFHEVQNMDLSQVPRMQPGDVARASLVAFDRGEVVCIPALEDPAQFDKVGDAQRALMGLARSTKAAARYT